MKNINEQIVAIINAQFELPKGYSYEVASKGNISTLMIFNGDEEITCSELKTITVIEPFKVMQMGVCDYFFMTKEGYKNIYDTVRKLHYQIKEKNAVVDIDVHLDLETSKFNKMFKDESGEIKHGAKVGQVFDVCARFTSYHHTVESLLQANGLADPIRFLIHIDKLKEQDFNNLVFQVKTAFADQYSATGKHDEGRFSTIREVEKTLCERVNAIQALLNKPQKYYEFSDKLKIRLVGKSVYFDMDFVQQQMPEFSMYLSHELKDISSFKNFWREINPKFYVDTSSVAHNALDDVLQTIEQQKEIRKFFANVQAMVGTDVNTLKEVNAKLSTIRHHLEDF